MTEKDEVIVSGSLPDPRYQECYPWHAKTWMALTRDLTRLPHALLLHGPSGLGKLAFAWRFAHVLLCQERGTEAIACGSCGSCQLFSAGTHPDLRLVQPIDDSTSIVIDQVREVRDFVALSPHTAARKLVIVTPAQAMNLNAANALLKVLEEPPASSLLVLVTADATRLPATIRSRCRAIVFRPPAEPASTEWLVAQGSKADPGVALRLAGGAPLRALAFLKSPKSDGAEQLLEDVAALRTGTEDPLRCAARWKTVGAEYCLEWFQGYVSDLIRSEMVGPGTGKIAKSIQCDIRDLFGYFDILSEARSLLDGPLDQTLLLEDLLIGWRRICT